MAGRPTKYTPARVKVILETLQAGNYRVTACRLAAIDEDTFANWLALYPDFSDSVEKAEAEAEARVVEQWQRHIPDNWQAARDFLARRHSARWGNTEKIEHSGSNGGALEVRVIDYRDLLTPLAPGSVGDSDPSGQD